MKTKKHLVIASDTIFPRTDGISRFLSELIPRLAQHFDITVLAPDFGEKHPEDSAVSYVYFSLSRFMFGDFRPARINRGKIARVIDTADVIWVHTFGPIGKYAAKLAKRKKKALAISNHVVEWDLYVRSIGLPRFFYGITKHFIKRQAVKYYNSATLIFVSSLELQHRLEDAGVTSQIEVVHLGVNSNEFKPAKQKRRLKRQLGFPEDTIIIAYCGRIAREKSLGTLVSAFKKIKRRYKNVALMLIGDGPTHLKKEFTGPNISVTGFVTDVATYLKTCDIFVMPSLTETTSLATMEAMAIGLPIISTRVGYIKEYLTHGLNGFFFEKEDVEDLFRKLEVLLNLPEKRKKFGLNARQIVKSHLTWENTAERMKKLLKRLMRQF